VAVALAAGGWWLSGGMQQGTTTAANRIALVAGALRPDAAVPAQYRDMITNAARLCAEEEVTPTLIAAILKAESNFNPAFSDPSIASYGIAGWTPEVFHSWMAGNATDYMKPADAIPAVSRYLCWLEQGYKQVSLPGRPESAARRRLRQQPQSGDRRRGAARFRPGVRARGGRLREGIRELTRGRAGIRT
jgi:hypothetical protein